MEEIKKKVNNNEPFIKEWLRRLPEDAVLHLYEMFKTENKSGGHTEEKLFRSMYSVTNRGHTEEKLFRSMYSVTNIQELDDIINALKKLRVDYVHTYMEGFANEYNKKHGFEINYNCEAFSEDLKS